MQHGLRLLDQATREPQSNLDSSDLRQILKNQQGKYPHLFVAGTVPLPTFIINIGLHCGSSPHPPQNAVRGAAAIRAVGMGGVHHQQERLRPSAAYQKQSKWIGPAKVQTCCLPLKWSSLPQQMTTLPLVVPQYIKQ